MSLSTVEPRADTLAASISCIYIKTKNGTTVGEEYSGRVLCYHICHLDKVKSRFNLCDNAGGKPLNTWDNSAQ